MAQKVSVLLTSDLSGDEADVTVNFGLDGAGYEIDLTSDEAAKLRDAMAPYVGNARRVGKATGRAGARTTVGPDPKAVRAWAASQGITVPERGRIPKDVTEKFLADQK